MRRLLPLLIVLVTAAMLAGCSYYETEYLSVADYQLEVKAETASSDAITVENINELSAAVVSIIRNYDGTHIISFASSYSGDPAADISAVCRQVITQNPLCAYCVENLDYSINKIVTYYEAEIFADFARSAKSIDDICITGYTGGIKSILKREIENGSAETVILVNHSTYNEENIDTIIQDIYFSDPLCLPKEPAASVSMFTDRGYQRLYDIKFQYGVTEDELIEYRASVSDFVFPDNGTITAASDTDKAVYAAAYLIDNCEVSDSAVDSTAAAALIQGRANSKGLSLAYNELCRRLGLECRIVIGQKSWQNHYWNIVKLNGYWYHVDMEQCVSDNPYEGFLLNDERMWTVYRWNLSEYPECSGEIIASPAWFEIPEAAEENSETPAEGEETEDETETIDITEDNGAEEDKTA